MGRSSDGDRYSAPKPGGFPERSLPDLCQHIGIRGIMAMPPRSQAQRRAMYAAAAGKSTIGIPKSVGKKFAKADKPGKLPKRVGPRRHK